MIATAVAVPAWTATPSASPSDLSTAQQQAPPGVWVRVRVSVPRSMRCAPFDVPRYLNVPPNFSIKVFARVGGARLMAIAPNNDLFVSQPSTGKVLDVRNAGGADGTKVRQWPANGTDAQCRLIEAVP